MSENLSPKNELLWRLAKDNLEHARQHESQRSTVCGLCLVLAGAALTAVGFDKTIDAQDFGYCVFVIGIGLFGALMSEKYYELFRRHGATAAKLLEAISDDLKAPELLSIKPATDKAHLAKFRFIGAFRLHYLWVTLHLLVAAIGGFLLWKSCH
jgi:hypothetical protein